MGGKGIIHRDLACRNILVGDNNTMKITDFGLSKHLYDDPVYVQNQDGKLPIRWMAIEAILEQKFSVQSDVYVLYHFVVLVSILSVLIHLEV